MLHPRLASIGWGALGTVLACLLSASTALAQDSQRDDWLRNPAMGNYKAYAEFKMGRYAQARHVWETLAQADNAEARFHLAILAEDGLGEPQDLDKARRLYHQAADGGNVKAQYRLGVLYSEGSRWPTDPAQARHYWGLAAAQGDRDAQARLHRLPPSPDSAR